MPMTRVHARPARVFRPTLWPTIAAIAALAATVLLGNWQARRAEYRASLQQRAEAMEREAPLRVRSASDISTAERYRHAEADGEYAAKRQIWLDNRTYKGAAGYRILTPLRLDDGTF